MFELQDNLDDHHRLEFWDSVEKRMIDSGCTPMMLAGFFKAIAQRLISKKGYLRKCSGLRDENGSLVFEGDLLGYSSGKPLCYAYHEEAGFRVKTLVGSEDMTLRMYFNNNPDSIVLGNVFQNKEFLKKDESNDDFDYLSH